MARSLRSFINALLVWEAFVVGLNVLLYLVLRGSLRTLRYPDTQRYLLFAVVLGIVVVPPCWVICRNHSRVAAALAGFGLGAVLSCILGWFMGDAAETWNLSWSYREAIFSGIQLAIPSGIGGAIIGLSLAKRPARSTVVRA